MRQIFVLLLEAAAAGAILAVIISCLKKHGGDNKGSNTQSETGVKSDTADELMANRLVVDVLTQEDLSSWAVANSSAAAEVRHVIAVPTRSIMEQIGCKRELHLDPSHSAIQMIVPKNSSDASLLRFRLIQYNNMFQPLQTQLMNSQNGVVALKFDD